MSRTSIRSTSQGGPQPYILIGTQNWQRKNLNVDTYRNGDIIPNVTDNTDWPNLTTGAWCYYNNDPANENIYGKLYNWYAVNDPRGIAPQGWHIPSDTEWTTLTNFLGGESVAGGKMKSITGWTSPNTGATNSSGYTGLPGGYRVSLGAFAFIGDYGYFWSSTEDDSNNAWSRGLDYGFSIVYRDESDKRIGYSVRCIKD